MYVCRARDSSYDNTATGTRLYNNSFNLRANTVTTPAINCAGKDAITFLINLLITLCLHNNKTISSMEDFKSQLMIMVILIVIYDFIKNEVVLNFIILCMKAVVLIKDLEKIVDKSREMEIIINVIIVVLEIMQMFA